LTRAGIEPSRLFGVHPEALGTKEAECEL